MFGLKSALIAKSQAFSEIVYSRKDVEHPEYSPASFSIFLKVCKVFYSHILVTLKISTAMGFFASHFFTVHQFRQPLFR